MATEDIKQENSFEKNKTGDQAFELPHGELHPAPEQAPVNENQEPGGSEAGDGPKAETNSDSNVTAPAINKPAFTVSHPADSAMEMGERSMAVVAPRK